MSYVTAAYVLTFVVVGGYIWSVIARRRNAAAEAELMARLREDDEGNEDLAERDP